jgi:hypothetical protein
MSEGWDTKYGPRRVRKDPPTLEEAIFAAQGITDDTQEQVDIAASLMGLPPDKIRDQVVKSKLVARQPTRIIATERGTARAVVVEHRGTRRPLADKRPMRAPTINS